MVREIAGAVVMAGGHISGLYALAAGTRVKALVRIDRVPSVRRVVGAVRAADIQPVVVVGPEAVRDALDDEAVWEREAGSALANLEAGLARLSPAEDARVLLCGGDVPALVPDALRDFIDRSPREAPICMPVVRKEAFRAAFPGNLGTYVRLREGSFTAGSQFVIRPRLVGENRALLQQLFDRRKSQIGMARTLGAGLIARLLTGRLSIGDVEARVSAMAGGACRAVLDCRPELAFDIDSLLDLRYLERWLARRREEPPSR